MDVDGGGKILEYIANFREYAAMPGDTRRDVWCRIPMSEGYAAIAIGIHCHPVLNLFGQLKLSGGGYVGGEVKRIMEKIK